MKKNQPPGSDQDLLLRYLGNVTDAHQPAHQAGEARLCPETLTPEEQRSLAHRLSAEPALQAELEKLQALHLALRSRQVTSFAPGFSARVARRLAAAGEFSADSPLFQSFRWAFTRMALPGMGLAIVLSLFNLWDAESIGPASSWVEDVFALPADSLVDSLSYTALSNDGY